MNSRRLIAYAFLILGLASCSHTTINNTNTTPAIAADNRTNKDIERLLPASALDQSEFPKTYVIGMMRACLKNVREKNAVSYQAGQADPLCACETEARVHQFTMEEYIEAGQAGWDPRLVPDAAKKSAKIITECLRKVLQ